jgi:transcription elongation factor Elf1
MNRLCTGCGREFRVGSYMKGSSREVLSCGVCTRRFSDVEVDRVMTEIWPSVGTSVVGCLI